MLDISSHGRVRRIALNRPEKRNALNAGLCHALAAAIEEADVDRHAGAILLAANGKAFCAGMDVAEVDSGESDNLAEIHERLFTIGARVTTPIIGAVAGAALGGGMGLVANCHIVVASEEATFGLTEIRLGLWPFLIYRQVAAALGDRRTLELALTGRIVTAAEAHQLNLVHTLGGEDRAMQIAAGLAEASPTAVKSGMQFVRETRGKDWASAGEIARSMRAEQFLTPDFREGITAFREKRRAEWPSLG
jgi:enoyl-CoA hydratase/carnithine racemase